MGKDQSPQSQDASVAVCNLVQMYDVESHTFDDFLYYRPEAWAWRAWRAGQAERGIPCADGPAIRIQEVKKRVGMHGP
jgi:hypothetical protein